MLRASHPEHGSKLAVNEIPVFEGTLYYLDQVDIVLKASPMNSRASAIASLTIRGPAVLVMRGRRGSFLYNLLRLSLVKRYGEEEGVALSSDAYSPYELRLCTIHFPYLIVLADIRRLRTTRTCSMLSITCLARSFQPSLPALSPIAGS